MDTHSRRIAALAIVPLLIVLLVAGCGSEQMLRPAATERPEFPPALLIVESGGLPICRLTHPGDVDALLAALPDSERDALLTTGAITTQASAVEALLHDFIAAAGERDRRFLAIPRPVTWGEIKIRYST